MRPWTLWRDWLEAGLLWLSIFLVPWQLRHTFYFAAINGEYFEYGSWHLYVSDIVIMLLLLVWLISRHRAVNHGPGWVNYPLLVWLVWLTASVGWAIDRPLAAITAAHWWLAYGWYVYLINRIEQWSQIVWPLIWGAGWQAVWGSAQYFMNHSLGLNWLGESVLDPQVPGIPVVVADGARQLRAHGMLPHANLLGGVLALAAPIWLYTTGQLSLSRQRQWLTLGLAILAIGIGLSFARGAWLVLVITSIGIGWWWWCRGQRQNVWLAVLMIAVFGLTLISQQRYVASRFDLGLAEESRSVTERIQSVEWWQRIVGEYAVRGAGVGNYTVALQQADAAQSAWWYQPIHNIYLLVTGELGVIGGAIWLWLIGAWVVLSLQLWRRKPLMTVVAWPLWGWLALGLVDHWPLSLQQGRLWLFLALALIILGFQVFWMRDKEKLTDGPDRTPTS